MDQLQVEFLRLSLHVSDLESELHSKEERISSLEVDAMNAQGLEQDHDAIPELSADAQRKKLDRLCKRRSNGSLIVPEHVRAKWLQGGAARQELRSLLVEANYDHQEFVKLVEVERERKKQLDVKVEGDFYTEEDMRKVLKLSETLAVA